MTAETLSPSTETQPKRHNLTPAEKERLLEDIAARQLPYEVIAANWGVTHQWVRKIASDNKEKIAEIRAEWGIRVDDHSPLPLWIREKLNRLAIRQGALLKIIEQQNALVRQAEFMIEGTDAPPVVSDHWAKLETLKQQILRHIDEIEGALPTRAPAVVAEGSKMTYEVKGVDVAATVRQWQEQAT